MTVDTQIDARRFWERVFDTVIASCDERDFLPGHRAIFAGRISDEAVAEWRNRWGDVIDQPDEPEPGRP